MSRPVRGDCVKKLGASTANYKKLGTAGWRSENLRSIFFVCNSRKRLLTRRRLRQVCDNLKWRSGGAIMRKNRLDTLLEGARATGLTLDYLDDLTRTASLQAVRSVIESASSMPSYMKSSDNPYVRRSARAPSSDKRVAPVSQLEN